MPAVSVRKSVTPDAIICLEDGKKFKSLKRHLRTTYDMTPEQYRAKWNLPPTTRWSRRTTRRRAPSLPRRWASASSARRQGSEWRHCGKLPLRKGPSHEEGCLTDPAMIRIGHSRSNKTLELGAARCRVFVRLFHPFVVARRVRRQCRASGMVYAMIARM